MLFHSFFIKINSFPLFYHQRASGADSNTIAKSIAEIFFHQPGFAIDQF